MLNILEFGQWDDMPGFSDFLKEVKLLIHKYQPQLLDTKGMLGFFFYIREVHLYGPNRWQLQLDRDLEIELVRLTNSFSESLKELNRGYIIVGLELDNFQYARQFLEMGCEG
jgi:hypothetical protein